MCPVYANYEYLDIRIPTFRPQTDLKKIWKNVYVVTEFKGSMCLPGDRIIHKTHILSSWGMIIIKTGQMTYTIKALVSPWNKNTLEENNSGENIYCWLLKLGETNPTHLMFGLILACTQKHNFFLVAHEKQHVES